MLGFMAAGCGLAAFLLGTIGQPAPTRAMPPGPDVDAALGSSSPAMRRWAVDRPALSVSASDGLRPAREVVIRLGTDLREGTSIPVMGSPEWDAERVWPLPEHLPDNAVVFALQDAFLASESGRAAALDALDDALATAEEPQSAWVELAHLEAERMLGKADHEAALAEHTELLEAWVEDGGQGAMPELHSSWSASQLGSDARALARWAEESGDDPAVVDLARLTAASLWLDWDADQRWEGAACDVLLDVVSRTDDPAVLSAAVDLLTDTRVALPTDALEELALVVPELPRPSARRLASFLSENWLEQGDPSRALQAIDEAILVETVADVHLSEPRMDGLRYTRALLEGRMGGPVGPGVDAALDAVAWQCWLELQASGDLWVVEGTDYAATLQIESDGARWTDWTDRNPHQSCMEQRRDHIPGADGPQTVQITIRLPETP
jgi:hypothetical protein